MPYQESQVFDTPDDTQVIWRYMTLSKLVWVLKKGKLHFHKVNEFDDPFEASVPRAYFEFRKRAIEEMEVDTDLYFDAMVESAEAFNHLWCANCWHGNDDGESAAMWEKYDERAVAITSTVGKMKSALENCEKRIYITQMEYLDFDSGFNEIDDGDKATIGRILHRAGGPDNLIRHMMKRKEYQHENEVRALTMHGEDWTEEGWDSGIDIGVDVDKLINDICISPYAPEWLAEAVEHLVEDSTYDLDIGDVKRSKLDGEPYHLWR